MMNDALSPEERAKVKPTFDAYVTAGSPEFARKCAFVKKLGPPRYEPVYMIQHGMGAFLGAAQGNVQGFRRQCRLETIREQLSALQRRRHVIAKPEERS